MESSGRGVQAVASEATAPNRPGLTVREQLGCRIDAAAKFRQQAVRVRRTIRAEARHLTTDAGARQSCGKHAAARRPGKQPTQPRRTSSGSSRQNQLVARLEETGIVAASRRDRTGSTSWGSQVRALHRPFRESRQIRRDFPFPELSFALQPVRQRRRESIEVRVRACCARTLGPNLAQGVGTHKRA